MKGSRRWRSAQATSATADLPRPWHGTRHNTWFGVRSEQHLNVGSEDRATDRFVGFSNGTRVQDTRSIERQPRNVVNGLRTLREHDMERDGLWC